MNRFKLLAVSMIALFTAAMAGCGGGGGGGTTPSTTGAAVSKGVITAKGSVIVNGVEFATNSATKVTIDNNPSTADLLEIGMVVKVKGSSDDATKTGTATEIEAEDGLQGTISSVDLVNKTITVMGQTVRVEDNVTRLSDDGAIKVFSAAGFAAGQEVEVHGFADDKGGLRATKVEKKVEGQFEIKGFVVSIGTGTFGLSLTPGGAATLTVTGTLPAGAVVGSLVEVKASAAPVGGAITATTVQLEDALGNAGEKVEVEGIVTSGDVNSFVVNGQAVTTSASTIFEGGLKADLVVGAKVEAEGPLVGGVIVATKISFRSNIRIEADITAFTAGSSLTVLGKEFKINTGITEINLGNLTALAVGTRVEVRGSLGGDGTTLVASRIDVKSADPRVRLQGPVTSVDTTAKTFSIIGISVKTDANTKFERDNDQSSEVTIGADTFFGLLKNNVTVVKVRWASSDITLPVEQAEIEEGNH